MAGLLYLPRLFVYHVNTESGSEFSETLKVMERRLYIGIMTPSMIMSWIFGLWLVYLANSYTSKWFHIKLLLVLILSVVHLIIGHWRKAFEQDVNRRSAGFYRMINEIPTVLMIGIVVLVVVKPF